VVAMGLAFGLVFGSILCLYIGILSLSLPESISSSVQLDDQNYYLTNKGKFGDSLSDYRLFQCNEQDLECKEVYHFIEGGSYIHSVALVVDQNAKEIHIFEDDYFCDLDYTYGEQPHENNLEDIVKIGTYKFAIWSYNRDEGKEFIFTKWDDSKWDESNSSYFACEIIPFHYATDAFESIDLLQGESATAIDLFIDGQLIYTYDRAGSRCHVEGCSIPIGIR
jgi:hypothetical protein